MFDEEQEYEQIKEYTTNITGCNKKCPCRLWIQCNAYVDITEREKRLKNKSNKDYIYIHAWYDINFRIQYEHGESYGNG